MVRTTAVITAVLWGLVSACAAPRLPHLTLKPASAHSAGEAIGSLDLGGAGEVFIRPRLLVTDFDSSPVAPEDLRLQVVLRVALKDGGTLTWSVASDGDAPVSEGGRRWRPTARGAYQGLELGGARLGPIAAEQIEAIEVLAAWLRAPALESVRAQGVAALGPAPPLGADAHLWMEAGREVERLGATPLVVARVPVSQERTREQGEHRLRLAIVAPGGSGGVLRTVHFVSSSEEDGAPWPTADSDGDLCLVVVDLTLQVHPSKP